MIIGSRTLPPTGLSALPNGDIPIPDYEARYRQMEFSSPPGYLSNDQWVALTASRTPASPHVFLPMNDEPCARPADRTSRAEQRRALTRQSALVQGAVNRYMPERGLFSANERALFRQLAQQFLFDTDHPSLLHEPYARMLEQNPRALIGMMRHCARVAKQLSARGMPADALAATLEMAKFCDSMLDGVKSFISALPFAFFGPALLPYAGGVDESLANDEKDEDQRDLKIRSAFLGAGGLLGILDHVFALESRQINRKHWYGNTDPQEQAQAMQPFVQAHALGAVETVATNTFAVTMAYGVKNIPLLFGSVLIDRSVDDATRRGTIKDVADCLMSVCAGTMVPKVTQWVQHGNSTVRDLMTRQDAAAQIWTAYEKYVQPDRKTAMANMREAGCSVACQSIYDMMKYSLPMNWLLHVPASLGSPQGEVELRKEMGKLSSWIPPITKDLATIEMLMKVMTFSTYMGALVFGKAAAKDYGKKHHWNEQEIDARFDALMLGFKPVCYTALVSLCVTAGLCDRAMHRHLFPAVRAWYGLMTDKVKQCFGRGTQDEPELTSVVTRGADSEDTESTLSDADTDEWHEPGSVDVTDPDTDDWHDAPTPDEPSTPPHPVPVGPPQHG